MEELSNEEIVEIYIQNKDEIDLIWVEIEGTLKEAVLEWMRRNHE
jgi:hypothetical protein